MPKDTTQPSANCPDVKGGLAWACHTPEERSDEAYRRCCKMYCPFYFILGGGILLITIFADLLDHKSERRMSEGVFIDF